MSEILDRANFRISMGGENLAIAVAQDYKTNEILMVAFMNREALQKTLETKKMHYFSASRKKLWLKGETSKHYQIVKEVFIDCDGDALLFKVEQSDAACHEGYYSCFFRKLEGSELKIAGKKIFEPKEVYDSQHFARCFEHSQLARAETHLRRQDRKSVKTEEKASGTKLSTRD